MNIIPNHMDIVKIFQDYQVRILGTDECPLFVANDVANILDIKNVRETIRDFECYEKDDVSIPDITGRMQQMTVLTEAGLYSLVLKSRKPLAKEFKKWVLTEVLPGLRKEGIYRVQKEADERIVQSDIKYAQLESFINRKHFVATDLIYLAKMHPSRQDDIYKIGRTADETSRRKNYRGQRAEPIEFIDTFPVIDFKRAESNLKYIVDPYLYSNTSDETVQMPYHLLKMAADAAIYIDKIKLRISKEMQNYLRPDACESPIEAANDEFIDEMNANINNIELIPEIITRERAPKLLAVAAVIEEVPVDVDIHAKFINEHVIKKEGSKLTRVRLQSRIKQIMGEDNLTSNTKSILLLMGEDKRGTTVLNYDLVDNSVGLFAEACCDVDAEYRSSSVALLKEYRQSIYADPNMSAVKFYQRLAELGHRCTKNTDGMFVVGILPKSGSLEEFIRECCEESDGEITMDDFVTAYHQFCARCELVAYKRPTLKARMLYLGYHIRKYNNGCISFTLLSIKK